jgi:hypothetical protein
MLLYIPNSWITTYALKFKYAGHGLFSCMNFNRDKKLYILLVYIGSSILCEWEMLDLIISTPIMGNPNPNPTRYKIEQMHWRGALNKCIEKMHWLINIH